MKRRSFPYIAVVGIAGLLLTGCSGQAGLKALQRDATPEDALPSSITLSEDVNRDSSRLLATKDGVRYFAVQSDDARTTCVAVVPPDENDWHVGCGETRNSGEIINVSSAKGPYSTILLGDESDTGKIESGWIKVSDNVLVSDR